MATVHAPELLIVMSGAATPEEVEHVVARLEEAGAQAHVTPGRQATVIGAIGERELLAALPLEGYAGVDQVLPILKPYKLVSRELSPDPTLIEVRGRRIGDGYFGFIAGPCTVESREQTLETARVVAKEGVTMSLIAAGYADVASVMHEIADALEADARPERRRQSA